MASPLDIGPLLVSSRIAQDLTQRELAERVGVLQPQVARWETSEYRSASLERVDAVARALGLDVVLTETLLAAEAPATYGGPATTASSTGGRALARLGVRPDTIAAFCRLHGIAEMALFGSSVRKDFSPRSDVDVLVTWAKGAEPHDFRVLEDLRAELRGIFRRDVDLVSHAAVERTENYLRRERILSGARTIYVAG